MARVQRLSFIFKLAHACGFYILGVQVRFRFARDCANPGWLAQLLSRHEDSPRPRKISHDATASKRSIPLRDRSSLRSFTSLVGNSIECGLYMGCVPPIAIFYVEPVNRQPISANKGVHMCHGRVEQIALAIIAQRLILFVRRVFARKGFDIPEIHFEPTLGHLDFSKY